MGMDLRNAFRVSFIMSEAPTPIPSAAELLADVQSRPVWDGASISPEDAQFLDLTLEDVQKDSALAPSR